MERIYFSFLRDIQVKIVNFLLHYCSSSSISSLVLFHLHLYLLSPLSPYVYTVSAICIFSHSLTFLLLAFTGLKVA